MKKLLMREQARSTSMFHEELTEPQLYLSSAQAGWEGLVAQAFHEPREMEGWSISPSGDIMLMLYAGGPIHVERRWAYAPWKGEDIHPGELVLNWGNGPSYEIRWWSLSTVPTQTLDIHLSRALVSHVAEEVVGVDLASLELVRRTGIRDPLLAQIGLALWQELEQPAPAGKLYAQTAAQLLALHLVRHYTSSNVALRPVPPSPQGLTDRQVKQVQDFILAHLSEDLSLDRLAQQIGFSPYHFARLFRKTTGASLHQVVLHQRIEHAQWLLHKTDMPLAHIARACGFADQSHLTQVFKRYLGLTPHIYRQQRDVGKIFTIRTRRRDSLMPPAQ
jgi:AraC family transcriptional regulator